MKPSYAGQKEKDAQERLCAGMALEWVVTTTLARVDCLSATHAIEVDWADKWAESIGQALYYAYETGKEPGIVLVCKNPAEDAAKCLKHGLMAESTLAHFGIKATVWHCDIDTEVLDECRIRLIGS
ncbi:MAG: hypothetical protein K8F25_16130 [Fimbriimonadaceae bacterium]|nr:hypothetical protein [Alphaproteobacteria bacterium]